MAAIGRDKKVVAGTLHFVAADRIAARPRLTDVTEKEIKAALKTLGLERDSAPPYGSSPSSRSFDRQGLVVNLQQVGGACRGRRRPRASAC